MTEVYITRHSQIKRKMRSIGIIKTNHLLHNRSHLSEVDKGTVEAVFTLQDTDHSLCKDVIVAVADCSHAGLDLIRKQQIHVCIAGPSAAREGATCQPTM